MGLISIIQALAVAFLAAAGYATYRALSNSNEEVIALRTEIRSLQGDVTALRTATARIETAIEDNTRTIKKLGLVAAANSLTDLAASVRAQIEATQWIPMDPQWIPMDRDVKR